MTIDKFVKKNFGGVLGPGELLDWYKVKKWSGEGSGKMYAECCYLFKKPVWYLHLFPWLEMPAMD